VWRQRSRWTICHACYIYRILVVPREVYILVARCVYQVELNDEYLDYAARKFLLHMIGAGATISCDKSVMFVNIELQYLY
jgi:hypothetical protein